jgi:nuclear pore complex protein Nup98-Nup96
LGGNIAAELLVAELLVGLAIGRENVGSICFKAPVDLTDIDLEDLLGGLVILENRSATVHPTSMNKPPVGKGLNVPALISLEHSWPRKGWRRSQREVETGEQVTRHIERLKNVGGTRFESYSEEDGDGSAIPAKTLLNRNPKVTSA